MPSKLVPSILISAATSGSGKTTLTLGLLKALRNRGLDVQPYKCGPDYIDTKFHELASGNSSVNLDLYMSSFDHVQRMYEKYAQGKDACITEGVMGLFDGYDRMKGSSAAIAELLQIPVILVLNVKATAYSIAATLYGFKNFYKHVHVAGVIFNFVSSEGHYEYLKDACKDVGVETLGYLPKQSDIAVPSRHLGLSLGEEYLFDDFAQKIAELVEKHIDIDRLLALTQCRISVDRPREAKTKSYIKNNLHIAVARDEAFNFIYRENLSRLHEMGNVVYFSPIVDEVLPEADFVYLPGGYPEFYLDRLSRNFSMKKSIKNYIEQGGKLWAECGGMMYLCSEISDTEGKAYPMVGIFDQKATMKAMKLTLGYRCFSYAEHEVKGHEFHYSHLERTDQSPQNMAQVYGAKNHKVDTQIFRYKNAIGGYTHIYWGELDVLSLFSE